MISLLMPIAQLVVLGYAFGGQVRNVKLGVVNQDHRLPAVKLRELFWLSQPTRTFDTIDYGEPGQSLADLRNVKINGLLTTAGFSQRVIRQRSQNRAHRGQHGRIPGFSHGCVCYRFDGRVQSACAEEARRLWS